MNFELDAGDVLLFRGEHLHSSELNVTDETRYVLTVRFAPSRPRVPELGRWHPWYDSRLVGTPLEPLSRWPSWGLLRFARHRLEGWEARLRHRLKWRRAPDGTGQEAHGNLPEASHDADKPAVETSHLPEELLIDAADLPVGIIRAVSPSVCVLRTEQGLCAFARHCTHEGADLAFGYYQDDRVRCAWHHLSFHPRSGKQPCQSLKPLKVFPLVKVGCEAYKIFRA